MNPKVLAFDLDNTLNISKTAISQEMGEVLGRLLPHYEMLIISGGKWELFESLIINRLAHAQDYFTNLHLMPTCGTTYFVYENNVWRRVYSQDLTDEEVNQITIVLERIARQLGYWEEKTWGDIIENRGTQVTFSALGQLAPPEAKYQWDPSHIKKNKMRDLVQEKLPGFDIKVGGTTSIDVTKPGIDKAYGLNKFMEHRGHSKEHITFIGDMLHEGGNDYPVKAMGIKSIAVTGPDHTISILQEYII